MLEPYTLSVTPPRAAVIHELRRLLPVSEGARHALRFGLDALDSYLPEGGLAAGALHEIVPAAEAAQASAFGFIVAFLARLPRTHPIIFVMPAYGRRRHGRLSGHGLNTFGLDPGRVIVVETAHRKETLWAMAEALRSAAPAGRRRHDRPTRFENQPETASRRQRCRPAVLAVAAAAEAGRQRRGDALAHRHRGSRARPFRPIRAPPMASAS